MFFDHSEIKLQINNTRKIEKPTYMRKLNNTSEELMGQRKIKGEIKVS